MICLRVFYENIPVCIFQKDYENNQFVPIPKSGDILSLEYIKEDKCWNLYKDEVLSYDYFVVNELSYHFGKDDLTFVNVTIHGKYNKEEDFI